MLIKAPQIASFRQLRLERFELEMLGHIEAFFPAHHRAIPEPALRNVIRLAHKRAGRYGLRSVRSVCVFLNSALWLGSRFDSDFQYPWAGAALTDPDIEGEREKADRLGAASVAYMQELAGPGERYFLELRNRLIGSGSTLIDDWMADSGSPVSARCAACFPQKWAMMSAEARSGLIAAGKRQSARYGMHDPAAVSVFTLLMFLLGSAFDTDPQFPWAAAILQDPDFTQEQKARALIRSGIDVLRRSAEAAP